jgi:hypothetical protein
LAQALDKLGIAAELKSKICLVSPPAGQTSPRVGEVVQRGEVQIGIQPISELMEVPGIDSSLEGSGFEPSVPWKGACRRPGVGSLSRRFFHERGIKRRRHEPLSKPRLCHAVPTVRIRLPPPESPLRT